MNEGRILNDGEQNEVARLLRRFTFEPERADELRSGSAPTNRFARLIESFPSPMLCLCREISAKFCIDT